ncbi:hypothetical protein [uncultured Helicobacter sp.]|uniref:hypothetical protein n=1 Tax=uncultured Helicobacter sp. TaxID=175537 RepID=UPI0026259771|nr:hypothetical protein [uncultured Helicobacter sp.]
MRIDTKITLEFPLKECYVSDEELLEVLRMTIHINELLFNDDFRKRVLEVCDEKHCAGKKPINFKEKQ